MPETLHAEHLKNPETAQPHDGSGPLRDLLIGAPEWERGNVLLPPGTVTVAADLATLTPETYGQLVGRAEQLLDGSKLTSSGLEADVAYTTGFLSTIDSRVQHERQYPPNQTSGRRDERVAPITFLFDGAIKPGEAGTLPSTILVHEILQPQQLQQLRAMFPDVPFINGQNQFLDGAGVNERAEAYRARVEKQRLGKAAVDAELARRANQTFARLAGLRPSGFRTAARMANEGEYGARASAKGKSRVRDDDGFFDKTNVPTAGASEPKTENQRMKQEARRIVLETTGGKDWDKLSDKEQSHARREIMKAHHPDRGGNEKTAKAVTAYMNDPSVREA